MRRTVKIIGRVVRLLLWVLVSPIVIIFPRNRKKILFGAWHGKQYSCNPKYLFEYIVSKGGFDCVWIGEAYLREQVMKCRGAKFARKGSLLALWHALTASFYACNINWREDIINFPRCRRVELLYLTHGYADKNVGIKQYCGDGLHMQKELPFQRLRNFLNHVEGLLYGFKSWCSESSEQGIDIRLSNQPFIMSVDQMLRYGKPRADYFINNKTNLAEKLKQKLKIGRILGVPIEKKWYIYVPTWRHNNSNVFSFGEADVLNCVGQVLRDQDAILIEKQHPIMLQGMNLPFGKSNDVYVLSPNQSRRIDTQELLMASDRLITDYSSVYYDFVLLDRPVIHYTYDYDEFMNRDMGFNYDMRKYGGGPFVNDLNGLVNAMKLSDDELLTLRNTATRREQLMYETGCACQNYYQFLKKRVHERNFFVR